MFTINDALRIEQLSGVTVKAGEKGLNHEIKTATIMDIPEIIHWIDGGELVIAGVLFEQFFSKAMIDQFILKGVVGIVTKEKFTHHIDDNLFKYCDEIGFPILLAPADFSWEKVIAPIFTAMAVQPYKTSKESQTLQLKLINSILYETSLTDICVNFYKLTGINHAILDCSLSITASANADYWGKYAHKIHPEQLKPFKVYPQEIDNSNIQTYYYDLCSKGNNTLRVFIYPIVLNNQKYGYIAIPWDSYSDKRNKIASIQQLEIVVALYFVKLKHVFDVAQRFKGLLLEQLLNSDSLPQQKLEELLLLTGNKLYSQYYVMHLCYKKNEKHNSLIKQTSKISLFNEQINQQFSDKDQIIVFTENDALICLIHIINHRVHKLVMTIRQQFLSIFHISAIYIGVSDTTSPQSLKKAFLQAKQVAHFLMYIDSRLPFYQYDDLGILKYFIEKNGKLSEEFIKEMHDTIIHPLLNHDKKYHTQLLHTLITYIDNDCSKTKTEKKLFIHKNTLIARFNVINKILNCNLNSAEDFFNIQLALKIHRVLIMTDII